LHLPPLASLRLVAVRLSHRGIDCIRLDLRLLQRHMKTSRFATRYPRPATGSVVAGQVWVLLANPADSPASRAVRPSHNWGRRARRLHPVEAHAIILAPRRSER
jgi:hypothetical protein